MCEDRERLIGYIYDECEAGERQQIEDHLSGCPSCREAVAGLRAVRQDLLAWDVPSHASIWRPVTEARVSWRAVPAWAMAAAATLMLLSGAAGGAHAPPQLSRAANVAAEAAVHPATAPVAPVATAPVTFSAPASLDLADLERRVAVRLRGELAAEMQAEMDARLQRIAAQQTRQTSVSDDVRYMLTLLTNDLNGMKKRQAGIEDSLETVALTGAQPLPVSLRQTP
jgi:hypothetical protein